MPMITLHNMSIIWKIQCISIQYTPMKWMHHYLLWIPPHHDCNISVDMPNLNNSHENKSNTIPSRGIHSKGKHKYRLFLTILTSNIMILIMVMHSLSKTNIQHFYNKNYKILTGDYMIYNN